MPDIVFCGGKSGYKNPSAVKNVLSATLSGKDNQPIQVGSPDMFSGEKTMQRQIDAVQQANRTEKNLGKRMVHSYLKFSDSEEQRIKDNPEILDTMVELCGLFFHCKGYQNSYSISKASDGSSRVDFAINSVNYITGKKFVYSEHLRADYSIEFTGYFNAVEDDVSTHHQQNISTDGNIEGDEQAAI